MRNGWRTLDKRMRNPESSEILHSGDLVWTFGHRDRIRDLRRRELTTLVSNDGNQRAGRTFRSIPDTLFAFTLGTMSTTKNRCISLDTVADNSIPAMSACGCQRINCAFERIKNVGSASHHHFERFIIFITASFALSEFHRNLLCISE